MIFAQTQRCGVTPVLLRKLKSDFVYRRGVIAIGG